MAQPTFEDFEAEDLDVQALVREAAKRHGVPEDLALKLAKQESQFNTRARSPKGAYGPMQLMAGTARDLGVNRFDPIENIDGGMRYLRQQLDTFEDPRMAVAAYNAGPGAVRRYKGVPPYAETQAYVNKILGEVSTPTFEDLEIEEPQQQAAAPGPSRAVVPAAVAAGGTQPTFEDFTPDPVGMQSMSARPRTLGERFRDNFEQLKRDTIGGALGDNVGANFDAGYADRLRDQKQAYDIASDKDPFYKAGPGFLDKALAGGATLSGVLAGSMMSPEGWVGPGKTALARVLWNAGINAGADAAVQPIQMDTGTRDKFDVGQVALSGLTGGAIQGGFEGVGFAAKFAGPQMRELGKRLKAGIWGEEAPMSPRLTPEEALQPGSGAVVNKKTGQPYTRGQTQTFEELQSSGAWDETAEWGTQGRPIAQAEAGVEPPPGTWYVDLTGQLKQASERTDVQIPPEALEPTAANRAQETPQEVAEVVVEGQRPADAQGPLADVPEARVDMPEAEATQPIFEDVEIEGVEPRVDTPEEDIPIPAEPTPEARARGERERAEQEALAEPDEIDKALDYIRRQRMPRDSVGPSLSEAIRQAGGLKDDGGELTRGLDLRGRGDAKGGRLINKSKGMSLDDAAQWAQERGYIGKPDLDQRATPQELLEALGRDLDGQRVYSAERDPEPLIRSIARDLGEELDFAGIDPSMTNREIRDALRAAWERREAEYEPKPREQLQISDDEVAQLFAARRRAETDPDQVELPGIEARNETAEAIARELLRREGRTRRMDGSDAGPLFDEVERAQPSLFGVRTAQATGNAPRASSTAGGSGLRRAPRAMAKARKDPKVAERLPKGARRIEDLAERFRKTLQLTHRQGRLSLKGAGTLGQYRPSDDGIRTRNVHELDALSHEGFHSLDFKVYPAVRAVRDKYADLMKKLDYDYGRIDPKSGQPFPGRVEEGFAEWGRWYVTNPAFLAKTTPQFFKEFEAAMAKDAPKALKELQAIQRDYGRLMDTASADLVQGAVVTLADSAKAELKQKLAKNGVRSTVADWIHTAYTAISDDLHPISRAVNRLRKIYKENAGQGLDLKVVENAYKIARLAKDAHAAAKMAIEYGVRAYNGILAEGPSLTEALSKALGGKFFGWSEDELEAFGSYLVSRRMVDEWDRFADGKIPKPPHTFGKEVWAQAQADFEAANPAWREAGDMIHEWNSNLWKLRYEAGLISKKLYEHAKGEHPFYVPLNRDVSDKNARLTGAATSDGANEGGTKAFRGSTRDFVNPIQMMMREAYELHAMIAANDARVALYRLGERAGRGSASIIEVIPNTDMKALKIGTEEALEAFAKSQGMDMRDLEAVLQAADMDVDAEGSLTFFRREPTKPRGEPIIFAWIEGKRVALRLADGDLGRDLYSAFVGMPRQLHDALGGIVDIVARGSGLLRYGVTTDPSFILANLFRDQIATFINTDVGFKPGITSARGLMDEVTRNAITREYAGFGGIMGGSQTHTFSQTDRGRLGRKVNAAAPGKGLKRFGSLSYITEISETGTRLGVYRLARDRALKQGFTPKEAAMEAAYAARDYMDFGRRGAAMGSLSRIVPFLNAAIQGMDKSLRVLSANGNLQKVFAPLVTGKDSTPAERRALAHARRAWIKWGALGLVGYGLSALYQDDAEYQAFNEDIRAKNWPVKVADVPLLREAMASAGITRKWIALPKPFELASLSNVFERSFEALKKDDPTAYDKMIKGLGMLWTPPTDIPLLKVWGEVNANKTFDGRPIVPEYKLKYDPELQTNSYTSEVMRRLSEAVGDATQAMAGGDREKRKTFSPAKAEHAFTGITGTMGRNAIRLSEKIARGDAAPATGLDDEMIAARFVKDPTRASQDSKDFFDRMSDKGVLSRAADTFTKRYEADPADAFDYMRDLTPTQRDYALAEKFAGTLWPKVPKSTGASSARMFHPMIRAQAAQSVISDLREELRSGKTAKADASGPLNLSREQRRDADDALTYLALAEMRGALQAINAPGYAGKTPISVDAARAELASVDPELVAVLDAKYRSHSPNKGGAIPSQATASALWPRLQIQLQALGEEEMARAMLKKRTRGKANKYAERYRQAAEAQ
jgi:hypothetical protein